MEQRIAEKGNAQADYVPVPPSMCWNGTELFEDGDVPFSQKKHGRRFPLDVPLASKLFSVLKLHALRRRGRDVCFDVCVQNEPVEFSFEEAYTNEFGNPKVRYSCWDRRKGSDTDFQRRGSSRFRVENTFPCSFECLGRYWEGSHSLV